MGISSDNHVIFNIHSGIRLSGVNHTDSTNGKAAAVKHGSKSYKYMDNLFFEKRIDTVKSKLDFDTWFISKIEFNSHNNLHEVLKDDDVINPMGGIDMVREFLTSADAF